MSVYTVHEPPVRTANSLSDAERLVFVRDGFTFWAFIAAPLWMLWHRMWVVLVGYVLVTVILIAGLAALGASRTALVVVGLFISLLVGLESSTLRRFTLRRRGWNNLGIVSGDDVEDAERRFFGVWLRQAPSQSAAPAAPPPPMPSSAAPSSGPPPLPRMARTPNVIGLFPEPGGRL
jgi:hypothetical protein